MKIGIRAEDKSRWERRVPLVPQDIAELRRSGLDIVVQSAPQRAIADGEFAAAGIPVAADLSDCGLIVGIKEIPSERLEAEKVYLFFAHVIKGQTYNMPMLQRLMDLGATLIDYERVVDAQNRRLIFFGRHAGLAGMVNTLWALGRRLAWEGIPSPFARIRQAMQYADLEAARSDIRAAAAEIRQQGLPRELMPLVVGFTGYGNVSGGAQEIFDLLPHESVAPADLALLPPDEARRLYKVVFKEADCFAAGDGVSPFGLEDYFRHGKQRYASVFDPPPGASGRVGELHLLGRPLPASAHPGGLPPDVDRRPAAAAAGDRRHQLRSERLRAVHRAGHRPRQPGLRLRPSAADGRRRSGG